MASDYHSNNARIFRQHLSEEFSDLDGAIQFMKDYVLKHNEIYPLKLFEDQTLSQFRLIGNISLTLDPQNGEIITHPRQTRYFEKLETAYSQALKEKYNQLAGVSCSSLNS